MPESWNVPFASMAVMALVGLFTVVFPLCLGVVFWRKYKGRWRFFLLGCVIFPLFALTLEGSINRAVLYGPIGSAITGNLWLYALFGGAMAGIFEECGRWAAFRLTQRWSRGPEDALMYGAGHGGIEAALLAGSMMLNNLLVSMALNQNGLAGVEALMGTGPLSDAQIATLAPLVTAPAGIYLWSGFERIVAIVIHLSLSVLVYAAVRNRSWKSLVLAIVLHAGVDACAILTSAWLPIAGVELVALVWAIALALLAWRTYQAMAGQQENFLQNP